MEMNFNEQLNTAISMCENKTKNSKFSTLYPFATENISGYINNFDLKNKSLLTLGSSCDQVINAVLQDCNDISVLDICPFTKFYFYLKKAAILTLSYEEFLHFFCCKDYSNLFGFNRKTFRKQTFYKISKVLKELDNESYLFWDKLFSSYSPLRIRKKLFSNDEDQLYVLKRTNLYLKDENTYNVSKYMVNKINPKFIISDISNVKLDRIYDNIWLSNVGQYMEIRDLKKIVDSMYKHLSEDGKILVCYLYKTVKNTIYRNELASVYNLKGVFKLFQEYSLELKSFIGVTGILCDCEIKDSVLIYRK